MPLWIRGFIMLNRLNRLKKRKGGKREKGGEGRRLALSGRQLIYRQYKKHRMALFGTYLLGCLGFLALCAPLVSQVTQLLTYEQNIFHRFSPPLSRVPLNTEKKKDLLKSYLEKHPQEAEAIGSALAESSEHPSSDSASDSASVSASDSDSASTSDADSASDSASASDSDSASTSAFLQLAYTSETKLADLQATLPALANSKSFQKLLGGFSRFHLLGTDELGRDVFIRLLYGTRFSMALGLIIALISTSIGLVVGTFAGYLGGWVDSFLMRLTDALLSLPILVVLIVVSAVDFQKIPFLKVFFTGNHAHILKLVIIICLFSWMTIARLVRANTLSLKHRDFVLASRVLGTKSYRIIARHITPNVLAPLLVASTLSVGDAILFEAALSFLGLGIQPPTASLGNMLFNAQEIIYKSPSLAIFPGMMLFFILISFNYIGDGLQDAIDSKESLLK